MEKYTLPTGYLFTDEYSKGALETLSIGDYGKHHNIKADFLGYSRPLLGVPNTECMPLSEKWVITLSTQYGCPMKCTFCDVPNVKFRGNATVKDLWDQLENALKCFPNVSYTERMNIHFARMGEPIFNKNVFEFTKMLFSHKRDLDYWYGVKVETLHPVLTTSLPKKFNKLEERILEWCNIKNEMYNGQAGLQFSINSTSEQQRSEMFSDMQLSLDDLSKIADKMPLPVSRKYCLNFAYATGNEVDGEKLKKLFDSNKFMCKITPIHNNNACKDNGIQTIDGYSEYSPYESAEKSLKDAGFDVLVFIPSMDEEDGLVTCGNVITGGSKLRTDVDNVRIIGQ